MSGQLIIPDVSEWNGPARWDQLAAAGTPAGIARVCYSDTHVDNQWRNNFPAMRQYLRWRGFYAYVLASVDVTAQARFFAGLVGRLMPGEVAFADIEEGDGDLVAFGQEWLSIVHGLIGGDEGEYSGESFAVSHLNGFNGVRLAWCASYGAPLHLAAQFHQFTDSYQFPGISTRADASAFNGTIDDLLALTGGAAITSPEEAMGKFGLTQIAFVPSALENLAEGDHDGRLPFYGTNAKGEVYAFNGAKPIAGLNARKIERDDVVGIAVLPGGGIVLGCDDGAADSADSDGWGASTYVLQ